MDENLTDPGVGWGWGSYLGLDYLRPDGGFNLAVASRFNVNRTVDAATPTRRAISLSPTPAVLKRSTSRTRRIGILSAGIRSPVQSQRSGP